MDITVTMNEEEIAQAVKDYMTAQNVVTIDKDVEVNLVAGRGVNGHSAVITIKSGTLNPLDTVPSVMHPEQVETAGPAVPLVSPKKPSGKSVVAAAKAETANLFVDETPEVAPVYVEEEGVVDENTIDEGEDLPMVDPAPSSEVESLFG